MDVTYFFAVNPDIFLIVVAVISLFVGSFLNVIIYRLPRMIEQNWGDECRVYLGLKAPEEGKEKLNLCLPFSHCPSCKQGIKPWHNIPIFSYLFLFGKCAYCKAHISLRYPFVEILTCLASTYVAWRFGMSWQTCGALLFTWITISLIFIDIDYHILPDHLTLLLLWLGLFLSIFSLYTNSHNAIIGAILGYLIFAITQWLFGLVTGKIGMGQGDFKFLAAIGAFLGWQMLPFTILISSLCGIIFGITHMLMKHQYKSVPFPFGPYLGISGWISLMWGNEIWHLYLQTFVA
ncbi:MAG: methyltransferase [Gammaproteobacteria bacterium RIFCSPHIGHO2_12_FULL_42_13]|nr:MAG: methyltransferase [Gammaproteobacteria bacterium RIFCSPHIGHO2_12_FULL_42_13]